VDGNRQGTETTKEWRSPETEPPQFKDTARDETVTHLSKDECVTTVAEDREL